MGEAGPSGCVWLASYPKSGNTWLRALLTAYLRGLDEVDPDDISVSAHFSDRGLFELLTGLPAAYFHDLEVDTMRAEAIALRVSQRPGLRFYKVHDRYRRRSDGGEVFPASVTAQAVVVVRSPLSVVPSWAAHAGVTIDEAITFLSRPATVASEGFRQHPQLPQLLGSWSEHVDSWVQQGDLPRTVVRYEDLRADPIGQLTAVLESFLPTVDAARVAAAVTASEFDRLRKREAEVGFAEAPSAHSPFFRSGQVDGWRRELTGDQVARVLDDHAAAMSRLGYDVAEFAL